MKTPEQILHDAEIQREQILDQIKALGSFRPGSFIERYVSCGNPACHCAQPGDTKHGPHYLITRKVQNKTVSKPIKKTDAEKAKEQVGQYKRFQSLIQDFVEVNVRICDAELAIQQAAEDPAAKKRGSRENSRRK